MMLLQLKKYAYDVWSGEGEGEGVFKESLLK